MKTLKIDGNACTISDDVADLIVLISKERDEVKELLAQAYIELSGKKVHTSDCATSGAPAYTPRKCDCEA